MSKTFYPITQEAAKKLRQGKLTASEWKIWSYLICVDPWGKQYKDLDTLDVISECEVSRATFYRAIAKFQELELFDFQDNGFSIRNLCGVSSLKNEKNVSEMRKTQSHSCENRLKNEKTVSEMRQDSHSCENRGSKVAVSASLEVSKISLDQLDKLDQDQEDDFSNFSDSGNSDKLQGLTAIAQIAIQVSKPEKRLPDISDIPIEGDLFRRRVEDFILKEMKFSPRDRTAYFSKFSPQNWQDWESKYKAHSPISVAHKIFIPEIVEVAPPDSEAVKDAIAQIRKSLGIKVAK